MKPRLDLLNLKITPLSAYGLVVLLLVLGGLCLEKLNTEHEALETRLARRDSHLATLNAIKDTDIWPKRLEQSLVLKEKTKDRLWNGSTSGVVAAQFQNIIRNISQKHDVLNMTVNVDSETLEVDGIEVLRFDYSGQIISGKESIDFYNDLAMHKSAIIISEMSMINSIRDNRRTNITMSGHIPISLELQQTRQAGQ